MWRETTELRRAGICIRYDFGHCAVPYVRFTTIVGHEPVLLITQPFVPFLFSEWLSCHCQQYYPGDSSLRVVLFSSKSIGSFKVTIIYTIIRSIIFLINLNGVVKEFNNGVINGDFFINGLQGLLLC